MTQSEVNGNHSNGTAHENDNGGSESGAKSGLRENARAATAALRDACRGASDTVTEFGEEAYQFGAKTTARLAKEVEAQPMTSMLIAGSLGLIAGVLLARR